MISVFGNTLAAGQRSPIISSFAISPLGHNPVALTSGTQSCGRTGPFEPVPQSRSDSSDGRVTVSVRKLRTSWQLTVGSDAAEGQRFAGAADLPSGHSPFSIAGAAHNLALVSRSGLQSAKD